MRETEYRGIRLDNGGWIYGSLIIINDNAYIHNGRCFPDEVNFEFDFIEVDPATVGQYTGLKDENGKKVYEGDIILHFSTDSAFTEYAFVENIDGIDPRHLHYYVVAWNNREGGFGYVLAKEFSIGTPDMCGFNPHLGFIVGNSHDNPELMKGVGE